MPTLRRARFGGLSVIALATVFGAVGCLELEAFLSPCADLDIGLGVSKDGRKFVDGSWHLTSIDGVAFTGNYRLPDGATLTQGSMDFHTRYLDRGGCEDPQESRGEIIALYALKTAAGVAQKPKAQAGSFTFVNNPGVITLRALGKSGTGTANLPNNNLRIQAKIPLAVAGFSLGTVTYDMVFTRP